MAKRRAETSLLLDPPSKRRSRSLSLLDLPLGAAAPDGPDGPDGGVRNPPSLLELMGSRCRKRRHYGEEPEEAAAAAAAATLYRRPDPRRLPAGGLLTLHTSGSFRCALTSSKKRPRDDRACPETKLPEDDDKADEDSEDCSFNSFQFWRPPLPELNLSLLDDPNEDSQRKDKTKVRDCPPDAMET